MRLSTSLSPLRLSLNNCHNAEYLIVLTLLFVDVRVIKILMIMLRKVDTSVLFIIHESDCYVVQR